MEHQLPNDVINYEIIPKLKETDLVLLKRAFPSLDKIVEEIIRSRALSQSTVVQQKQFNIYNSISSPQLSPSSGSIVAYIDNFGSVLKVLSSVGGSVIAETPLDVFFHIDGITINNEENIIIVSSRTGINIFKLDRILSNNQSISLTKVFSMFLHPVIQVIPGNVGHPELVSSQIICDVDSNGLSVAAAKISCAFKTGTDINVYLRIDTVLGNIITDRNENLINLNLHGLKYMENKVQNDEFISISREMIIHGPECRSLFLQSNLLLRLGKAQIILNPFRIFFPPTSDSNFALLVNPSANYNGPWSKSIKHNQNYPIIKSTVAPVRGTFTISWKIPGGICVQRMSASNGNVKSSLAFPIPNGSEVLDILESSDGQTCTIMFGFKTGNRDRIVGWVVGDIENGGIINVSLQQQNFVTDSLTHSIGPDTNFYKSYDINKDGQLISAVVAGNSDETTKIVVVFQTATGEIVAVTKTWAMEHLNGDPLWRLGNFSNQTFRVSFSKNVSNQLHLYSKAGHVFWIGTKKLGPPKDS